MSDYLTDRYRTTDRERVLFLIENFPFATLVACDHPTDSAAPAGPDLAHVPLVVDRAADGQIYLIGHIDNQNPFLHHLDTKRVSALFHGPNAYISPRDYVSRQFPTWNYAVARVTGVAALVSGAEEKTASLVRMVDGLESANGSDYRLDHEDPQVASLVTYISFFRIRVESIYGVFKFAQEKRDPDRVGARAALLRKLHDAQNRALPRLAADLDDGLRPEGVEHALATAAPLVAEASRGHQ